RAIGRERRWGDALFGYRVGARDADLSWDPRDNAAAAPLAVVSDPAFTWGADRPPRIPWHDTRLSALHVQDVPPGHPALPAPWRGTFLGLASEAMLCHLTALGCTAVTLRSVHAGLPARGLGPRGRLPAWADQLLGWFAPANRYTARGVPLTVVQQFKIMVARLHAAGLEVLLDVVATAEGNHLGPTLSLRGIDNAAYYQLTPDQLRYYRAAPGAGNALNLRHPRVLQFLTDSLRYWVRRCTWMAFALSGPVPWPAPMRRRACAGPLAPSRPRARPCPRANGWQRGTAALDMGGRGRARSTSPCTGAGMGGQGPWAALATRGGLPR